MSRCMDHRNWEVAPLIDSVLIVLQSVSSKPSGRATPKRFPTHGRASETTRPPGAHYGRHGRMTLFVGIPPVQ
eukprot:scaffold1036_cov343-Prasinococcus_capsulatus_cf.AAC.2